MHDENLKLIVQQVGVKYHTQNCGVIIATFVGRCGTSSRNEYNI